MRLTISKIPLLSGFLAGIFVGILVVSLLIPLLKVPTFQHEYGQALADITAQRSIEPTFRQNFVALQSLLTELQEYPSVKVATIHDIENNLLVQSGDARSVNRESSATFTAPILLHDSVAGYVSVTTHQPNNSTTALWAFISLAAITTFLMAGWLTWRSGAVTLIPLKRVRKTKINTEITPEPDLTASAGTEKGLLCEHEHVDTPPKFVFAAVQVKNFPVLQQQLSSGVLENTLNQVSRITSDVLELYHGASYEIIGDQFVLSFYANDATNEALFRAVCSAYLILELASIVNKIPLDLAAFVAVERDQVENATRLPVAGLMLEGSASKDELIQKRLTFMDLGDEYNRQVVSGFTQPYKSLLDNQQHQLAGNK